MVARGSFRGHPIVYKNNKWVYEDTEVEAGFNGEVRPCKKCGLLFEGSNIGESDPCLGDLPGVDNACCGHGDKKHAYIRFTNGVVVKGFEVENSHENKSTSSSCEESSDGSSQQEGKRRISPKE